MVKCENRLQSVNLTMPPAVLPVGFVGGRVVADKLDEGVQFGAFSAHAGRLRRAQYDKGGKTARNPSLPDRLRRGPRILCYDLREEYRVWVSLKGKDPGENYVCGRPSPRLCPACSGA